MAALQSSIDATMNKYNNNSVQSYVDQHIPTIDKRSARANDSPHMPKPTKES